MTKFLFVLLPFLSLSQSYAPAPGEIGSTAIHKDSSLITYWADNLSLERGYLDISTPFLGTASYGVESDGEGMANGSSVVSLGDSGVATYYLSVPFSDGPGPDFAIFENGFADDYIELAFVEVSSDNQNFFRFEAQSETPTDTQTSNFDFTDCRYVHNLAGKYSANYGTPFDLSELDTITGLDVTAITAIRIVDVVGSIDPNFGSYDSQGRIINDPYPTAFESGGFDLDALALLQSYSLDIEEVELSSICSPNPVVHTLHIDVESFERYELYDTTGQLVALGDTKNIDFTPFEFGAYILLVVAEDQLIQQRILKQ